MRNQDNTLKISWFSNKKVTKKEKEKLYESYS